MFEALVIEWILEASASAVARNLNVSWGESDGMRKRAVERVIARREITELKNLCVDDTSYKRGHPYLANIADQHTEIVLDVKEDRVKEILPCVLESITIEERAAIESV